MKFLNTAKEKWQTAHNSNTDTTSHHSLGVYFIRAHLYIMFTHSYPRMIHDKYKQASVAPSNWLGHYPEDRRAMTNCLGTLLSESELCDLFYAFAPKWEVRKLYWSTLIWHRWHVNASHRIPTLSRACIARYKDLCQHFYKMMRLFKEYWQTSATQKLLLMNCFFPIVLPEG